MIKVSRVFKRATAQCESCGSPTMDAEHQAQPDQWDDSDYYICDACTAEAKHHTDEWERQGY